MDIKTYCWLDAEGNINSVMAGENIQAPEDYDYFFVAKDWSLVESLHLYSVVDGTLMRKEV